MICNIRFFVLLALLTVAIGSHADDGKSFSRQMNEIKRCGDYIYAESSAPNEADAKTACDALLKIEITKYLVSIEMESQEEARILKDISEYNREYLVQPRGDLIRVFGYVPKSSVAYVNEKSKKKPSAKDKKKDTYPRVEKNEPPQEAKHETVAESGPHTQVGALKTDGLQLAKWQIDMLETVAHEPDIAQAKKLLNRYKYQNRIKRLGDKSVANPRPADSFYLVYDNSGKLLALLAPSQTTEHYDMLSGAPAVLNTTGNQFIWLQISK